MRLKCKKRTEETGTGRKAPVTRQAREGDGQTAQQRKIRGIS